MFNHGGLYGPEILLDKDIVYVNLNYRLGPLGKKILFLVFSKTHFLHCTWYIEIECFLDFYIALILELG